MNKTINLCENSIIDIYNAIGFYRNNKKWSKKYNLQLKSLETRFLKMIEIGVKK